MIAVAVLVLVVVVITGLALRRPEPADRARFLRRTALGLIGAFVALGSLFIVGETIDDPGGWPAVGLIAAWAVPLIALGALSWSRPEPAAKVLTGLTALMIAASILYAASPGTWRTFEDRHGPIRAIALFVLCGAAGLLGRRRPRPAGVLLLVLAVVPAGVTSLAVDGGMRATSAAVGVVTGPAAVAGVLFLVAVAVAERTGPPPPPPQT